MPHFWCLIYADGYIEKLEEFQNTGLQNRNVTRITRGNVVIEYFMLQTYGSLGSGIYFENYQLPQADYDNIISLGINGASDINSANYIIYKVPDTNYVRALSKSQNSLYYCYVVYKK